MYRVFRADWYSKKFEKLDRSEQMRVEKFEQALKQQPNSGKPLGYEWIREKKFDGKRMIFLIYENHKIIFLITITDKKAQQETIDFIKSNLDNYKEIINKLIEFKPL